MTERKLPPALEEKAFEVSLSAGSISHIMLVEDLLDWLYGRDGEPGLYDRVSDRYTDMSDGYEAGHVFQALRAELGMEEP